MTNGNQAVGGNVSKGGGSKARGASKKLYFARNANFAITNKNRDRRLARVARRAAYWLLRLVRLGRLRSGTPTRSKRSAPRPSKTGMLVVGSVEMR